jgi:5-methylthioribose kinase
LKRFPWGVVSPEGEIIPAGEETRKNECPAEIPGIFYFDSKRKFVIMEK